MIGITNVGGGGGMAYAYIGVIYDAGATVTCTDGNKTYRAKDTSGLYTFPIPYAATWIVTATDGTQTKSESVVITSLWQDVVANLTFWDGTIFYNGNQYLNITGGWEYNPNLTGPDGATTSNVIISMNPDISISKTGGGRYDSPIQTVNRIDLTTASTIELTYAKKLTNRTFMVTNDTTGNLVSGSITVAQSSPTTTATGTQTIDVTSLSGSYYFVCLYEQTGTTSQYTQYPVQISKIKLLYD